MDLKLFNELMRVRRVHRPAQQPEEWRMFLQICEMYLKMHNIKNPVVVELGILYGMQRKFYEKFLGAEYIGVDISDGRTVPDILGDTRKPETLKALKEKLRRRLIDILFIDGLHTYEGVKSDFETYSPLCNGIVAFHDIEAGRFEGSKRKQVWKFWDDMKEESYIKDGRFKNFMFLSIHQYCIHPRMDRRLGIGVIIKNEFKAL